MGYLKKNRHRPHSKGCSNHYPNRQPVKNERNRYHQQESSPPNVREDHQWNPPVSIYPGAEKQATEYGWNTV